MSSVTFPPALGGDGSTVTDDASPVTGLANGGHRLRFVAALAQMVAVMQGALAQAQTALTNATTQAGNAATSAGNAATSANNAAASAQTALTAPGTQATSTATLTVSTGSMSFSLAQTGKGFIVGQWVAITDTSLPGRWLAGQITAFNSGTGAITVQVVQANGTGSASTWAIAPTPPVATLIPTQWAGVSLGPLI